MPNNIIRVGDVEIVALSDGMLEFDPCNFFPTMPREDWRPYESHLTEAHKVRCNLGSDLVRSHGRTGLRGSGRGAEAADAAGARCGPRLLGVQGDGGGPG